LKSFALKASAGLAAASAGWLHHRHRHRHRHDVIAIAHTIAIAIAIFSSHCRRPAVVHCRDASAIGDGN